MRSTSAELRDSAAVAFVAACEFLGLDVARTEGDAAHDVVISRPGRADVLVELKARAVAQGDSHASASGQTVAVVADIVTDRVRDELDGNDIGWLDRRGHMRLKAHGLEIDSEVPAMPRLPDLDQDVPADPFGRGRAPREVALALLVSPDVPPGVREIGRSAGLAPSTVSRARDRLRRALLITHEGQPLLPEMFWELADHWRPRWFRLAAGPKPSGPSAEGGDRGRWVQTGDLAAAAHGAPVIVSAATRPDYFVLSQTDLSVARRELGDAGPAETVCRVAVAPARIAVTEASPVNGSSHPMVVPVVAALDMARDRARGREILEGWRELSDGQRPVWNR